MVSYYLMGTLSVPTEHCLTTFWVFLRAALSAHALRMASGLLLGVLPLALRSAACNGSAKIVFGMSTMFSGMCGAIPAAD